MNHLEQRIHDLTREIAYFEQHNLKFSPSYNDKKKALNNLLMRVNKEQKFGEDI